MLLKLSYKNKQLIAATVGVASGIMFNNEEQNI